MLVTIFTPTYNRMHLLSRLYESLLAQSSKNFMWLVIDDGSIDNTKELIESFIAQQKLNIQYIQKTNGGMHTAHNIAFDNTHTELVFCLDSDDMLTVNSVELIENHWAQVCQTGIAGIVAYNLNKESGEIIGNELPDQIDAISFYDIYYKYFIAGDKALVYRTELIKKKPYPTFVGEKFVPLDVKYLEIEETLSILREPLRIVEYQPSGYSANINVVYARNPRGFIYYHLYRMKRVANIKTKIKSIIHYIGLTLYVCGSNIVRNSNYRFATFILMPVGWLRYKMLQKASNRLMTTNEL